MIASAASVGRLLADFPEICDSTAQVRRINSNTLYKMAILVLLMLPPPLYTIYLEKEIEIIPRGD